MNIPMYGSTRTLPNGMMVGLTFKNGQSVLLDCGTGEALCKGHFEDCEAWLTNYLASLTVENL